MAAIPYKKVETYESEGRRLGKRLGGAVTTALNWGEPTAEEKARYESTGPLGLGGWKKRGYRYNSTSRHYDRYVSKRAQGPGRS